MKKQIIITSMLLCSSAIFAQMMQNADSISHVKNNSTSTEERMYHRLGLGDIDDPPAMFSAFQGDPLQKTKGSYITLYSFITNCFYNVAYNRLFLVRDTEGDEWTTARFHEGISIDSSFSKPGETRTWWERDPYDKIQSWGDGAETYMTINRDNVGIGTINPQSRLEVNGSTKTTKLFVGENVGIGTLDTQGYKLAVNGTIRAKEIKLESNWADFVFKEGYNLPTLEEVKQHIDEKGTLPGVPSEDEVKANGVNLAETDILLLQKIEELTLYIIELKQEINKLKLQVDNQ